MSRATSAAGAAILITLVLVLVLVPMLMLMLVGDAACRVLGSRRYGRGKVGGFQVGARETTVECPAGKKREGGGAENCAA